MRAIKRAHGLARELGWLRQADVGSLVSGQWAHYLTTYKPPGQLG